MQENKNMITVSQLNDYIRGLIESVPYFSSVFVRGEISNFKNHSSGHYYFTLKDEKCSVRAVMFRSDAQRLDFIPEDGMKVICHGRVSVYPRDGIYQIYADDIQPDGVGALYFAFEHLKRTLESEGLFEASRKRSIPRYPRRIGIITSPTGAAVRDMINILGRRWPAAEIYLYPSQVQGASAPPQLCAGISFFNEKFRVDTIIIGRGGGSLEDLWAFNNETLARAVAASDVPVISAVGHEVDFTICDFAADLRAPTPSAAAELAVPDRAELLSRLDDLSRRRGAALPRLLAERRRALGSLASSRILSSPARVIDERRLALDALSERLDGAASRLSAAKREALRGGAAHLEALSPLATLARGYAVVSGDDGEILRDASRLVPGERVRIRLSLGCADARIESIMEAN